MLLIFFVDAPYFYEVNGVKGGTKQGAEKPTAKIKTGCILFDENSECDYGWHSYTGEDSLFGLT